MAQIQPCEYRGEVMGERKVNCCRGKPPVMLPIYDCKLGNTGHGGADHVTWRDCERTYRRNKNCTPETCIKALQNG